ncbi:MAG TPA: glycosyltransferase, partial [Bacteroidota bacterium]|nr:glycosyltransferase [Bacteroidota bacterium]
EQYIANHRLGDRVFLRGYTENIIPWINGFDMMVMPSYYEGFGYSAVEAMAARKPVIGTNVSSLPEIIEDGVTGILVAPRSAEQLADAMERLANDPVLRISMGENGRKRADELFTESRMIKETEAFFREVAERKPAARSALTSSE